MDYPPFTDALARFRSFLNDQGHVGPIGWVFPSDVLLIGGTWLVRSRPQDVVTEEVAETYRNAIIRRLGVKFAVLCHERGRLWCYIYCPNDLGEAERSLMPDGLKLSVPMPVHQGRGVADDNEWERLKPQDMLDFKLSCFS